MKNLNKNNNVEQYEVEKIIDKRTKSGKVEYLIKWESKTKNN